MQRFRVEDPCPLCGQELIETADQLGVMCPELIWLTGTVVKATVHFSQSDTDTHVIVDDLQLHYDAEGLRIKNLGSKSLRWETIATPIPISDAKTMASRLKVIRALT